MDEPAYRVSVMIKPASQPTLSPHMKLRHDLIRDRWVLLGPERILTPNEQAADMLRLCNGKRSVSVIAGILAENYHATPTAIELDILPLLQCLVDGGVVRP